MIKALILALISLVPPDQQGWATWYGDGNYHGEITATGEKFNPLDQTCASRTIPLGTSVLVANDTNYVICEVNDRGPYGAMVDDNWVVMFRRSGYWWTREKGKLSGQYEKRPGKYRGVMDLSLGTARALYQTNDRPPNGYIRIYHLE